MKRSSKRPIETIQHGPFKVVIRMDDMGVFSADYGALETSGTLPQVRVWARKTLRELCNLKWHPVMEVHFDDEDNHVNNLRNTSNLECYIERHWIAWDGKKWIECPWVVDKPGHSLCVGPANSERTQDDMPEGDLMAERIRRSQPFHDGPKGDVIKWPLIADGMGKTYYVPYSEESWATMLGILERIRELRSGINKLLSTSNGWRVLAKVAETKLLSFKR